MEQRAAEQHSLKQRWIAAGLKLVVLEVIVSIEHDLLDIAGGLNSHLDAVLQDADGEVRSGWSGKEQSEFRIDFHWLQGLHHLFQVVDPGELQVRVLEEEPLPIFRAAFEVGLRDRALALSQWDLHQLPPSLVPSLLLEVA